jgi:putative glutamine amidotransferase
LDRRRGPAERPPRIAVALRARDPKIVRKAKAYLDWVERGGGAVRLVAPGEPRPLSGADGLLLLGGEDVAPERYGETDRCCERINPQRDAFELALLRSALHRDLPILGICRGVQILAVALGGTLLQDLPAELPRGRSRVIHRGPRRTDSRHRIVLAKGTALVRLIGRDALLVNSHHHQAVRAMSPGVRVSARSADGVIEAIEHPDKKFVLGIQWHPERWPRESSEAILRGFLAACGLGN